MCHIIFIELKIHGKFQNVAVTHNADRNTYILYKDTHTEVL